jgi:hypothetical protein
VLTALAAERPDATLAEYAAMLAERVARHVRAFVSVAAGGSSTSPRTRRSTSSTCAPTRTATPTVWATWRGSCSASTRRCTVAVMTSR